MNKLVFADKVLNQQICSECLNYLSVGPVLISCEGEILCGRCSKYTPTVDKASMNYSLYNVVAEKIVFKCANNYEGCEELLFFNETMEHEKNCRKKGLACQICAFEGNGCQLNHHFDKEHPEEVIKEDTFKIIVADEFSKKLVFVKNNHILCLSIFVSNKFIEISNRLITPAPLKCKFFTLKFFKFGSNIQFISPRIRINHDSNNPPSMGASFVLDQAEIVYCFPSRWCLCKIELIDEAEAENLNICNIIKKIDTQLPTSLLETSSKWFNNVDFNIGCILKMSLADLRKFINSKLYLPQRCGNCKKISRLDYLYVCPEYHISCRKCTVMECPKCKAFCDWTNNSQIHNISLSCEWNCCLMDVNIFEFTEHKRDCKFRKYKCPDIECGFVGNRDKLKDHWHVTRPIVFGPLLRLSHRSHSLYWLNNYNEMFYVTTEWQDDASKFLITVHELDVILHGKYKFDIFCGDETNEYASYRFRFVKSVFIHSLYGRVSTSFTKYLDETDLTCQLKLLSFPDKNNEFNEF